jgi:hypothetical protein
MAGLVPAIHVFDATYAIVSQAWMPGTRPGMTAVRFSAARSVAM